MASYLIGIDVGTNGCKVTLLREDGEVVASTSKEYSVLFPKPGWAEQDPGEVYRACIDSVRSVVGKSGIKGGEVVGIGFTGHMHSPAFIESDGKPARPIIVWMDQRSVEQVEHLKKIIGEEVSSITYNPITTTYTLPQLLWVKSEEPHVWKRIYKVFQPKDYVRYMFTRVPATDYTDAAATLMFDCRAYDWSMEILEKAEIPPEILPEVHAPHEIVGGLVEEVARETGLKKDTPVVAGAGDVAAESFAVGLLEEGSSLIRLGTAGAIFVTTKKPIPDPKKRVFYFAHVIKGLWFVVAATQASGWSVRWLRQVFYQGVEEEEAYKLIDSEAEEAPVGCEGLIYHPYLMGERSPYWDPYLRGDFIGITARHSRSHFSRAVLEGVAFSFKDNFEVVKELGVTLQSVKLIGGGAKSRVWRRIICDVLGVKAYIPKVGDASLGAAMLAGLGVGVFKSHREAVEKCLKIEAVEEANLENHKIYEELFKIYKEAQERLEEVNHKISSIVGR